MAQPLMPPKGDSFTYAKRKAKMRKQIEEDARRLLASYIVGRQRTVTDDEHDFIVDCARLCGVKPIANEAAEATLKALEEQDETLC